MQFKKFQDTFLIRLEKGEEHVSSLAKFCTEQNVLLGDVRGIGAASSITLGFFTPGTKAYRTETFERYMEITSLIGNITQKDGKPYLHLHLNAAGDDYRSIGGHLVAAVISVTGEIWIRPYDGNAGRKLDDEIGINLINFA